MSAPKQKNEVRVWDGPVRLVHWIIALLFCFQVMTAWIGGDAMQWHGYSGYCILTLAVFRILWGFAGSTHARFASFVRGPREVLRFTKRLWSRVPVGAVGHNPLGGWMVVLLLVSLLLQGLAGLFANDGADFEGPLAKLVSFNASLWLSTFHRGNAKLIEVLAVLHVLAVALHWIVKGENLVGPMISGLKRLPGGAEPTRFPGPARVILLLAVAVALVGSLVCILPWGGSVLTQ